MKVNCTIVMVSAILMAVYKNTSTKIMEQLCDREKEVLSPCKFHPYGNAIILSLCG